MKIWLKIFLGVLGGFGGGFAAGFFVHKKMNDVKFEEVGEEELEALMQQIPEDIRIAAENKPQECLSEGQKGGQKAPVDLPTDPNQLRNSLQGKTPYIHADDAKKKEYSKMWNAVKEYSGEENANDIPVQENEDDLDPDFMNMLDGVTPDEVDESPLKKEPYQITLQEFYEERREYDKVTIDWYEEDNVVLDEREDIIPDPKSYVGCSMQELFNLPPLDMDPDSVFIRNDTYGTDYEIIRHHASYKEYVAGEGSDD